MGKYGSFNKILKVFQGFSAIVKLRKRVLDAILYKGLTKVYYALLYKNLLCDMEKELSEL